MNGSFPRARARSHRSCLFRSLLPLLLCAACAGDPVGPTLPSLVSDFAPAPADTSPPPLSGLVAAATPLKCGLNQPAGFHLLDSVALSVKNAGGSGPVVLGPWLRAMVVGTDLLRGKVAQFNYNTGMTAGRAPGEAWLDEPSLKAQNVSDVYVCAWIQPGLTFVGHNTAVNKFLFLGFGKNGSQGVLGLHGSGARPLFYRFTLRNVNGVPVGASMPTCSSTGCTWHWKDGPVIPRGSWTMVEVVAHSGPAGSKTSWMDGFLNGAPTGRVSGFDFLWPSLNGTNPRAEKIAISPTWGGTGGVVTTPFNLQVSGLLVTAK